MTVKCIASKDRYEPSVHGVGYVGVGRFKAFENGDDTYEYKKWRAMLRRCYCEKSLGKYPTYKGCTVHPDWHNFQVFAEWLSSNEFYELGYELDKDLLSNGSKVYSKDTCSLVPMEINRLLVNSESNKGLFLIGVYYNEKASKYGSRIRVNGKREHLGFFDCQEQAHQAYVDAKKAYVKKTAIDWRDRIDVRVFDALINWQPKYQ